MGTVTKSLTDEQRNSFKALGSQMGSLATLPIPKQFPQELTFVGINARGTPRNSLVGYVLTSPSGSQLAIETVFFDSKDQRDNSDLHIVNYESKTITSYYQGRWGTWTDYYGQKHWEYKEYLRQGTNDPNTTG